MSCSVADVELAIISKLLDEVGELYLHQRKSIGILLYIKGAVLKLKKFQSLKLCYIG